MFPKIISYFRINLLQRKQFLWTLRKWWSIWVTEYLNRIHKRTLFSYKIISWVELLSGIIWCATKSFLETRPYLDCRGNGLEQVRMRRRTVLHQYNIQQPMRTVKELEWASLDLQCGSHSLGNDLFSKTSVWCGRHTQSNLKSFPVTKSEALLVVVDYGGSKGQGSYWITNASSTNPFTHSSTP